MSNFLKTIIILLSIQKYFFKLQICENKNNIYSKFLLQSKNHDYIKIIFVNKKNFLKLKNLQNFEILDTRSTKNFSNNYFPNSINIPNFLRFEKFANLLLDKKKIFLIISEKNEIFEISKKLKKIEIKNFLFLKNGFENFKNEKNLKKVKNIFSKNLKKNLQKKKILDIRTPKEWKNGIIQGSYLVNLSNLQKKENLEKIKKIFKNDKIIIACSGGVRSVMGYSILEKLGFENFENLFEGISGIGNDIELVKMD